MKNISELFGIIEEIINYAKDKTRYEVQCQVNDEITKLRKADFSKRSKIYHEITKDLALTKNKLKRFEDKTRELPEEYFFIIMPLIEEVEARIKILKIKRQNIE